jgi:hypothetical protein
MKDLKCGLKECRFNKGYCCCADCITVDPIADCTSYEPLESKRRSLFEAADEFIPANYSVDTQVKCAAPCIFNKDKVCRANGITVMNGEAGDAVCLTYITD